ncbi:MAG: 50S ribosomal protein L35 [Armatimonadetes bacterium]|nr:50S ribosomal protein L35 [Armatimonadota bacterium]
MGKATAKSRSQSSRVRIKTQKTAAKRVKRTGSGKIKVRHAFKGHLLTRKSAAHKRRLKKSGIVSSADRQAMERLVPPGS